MAEPVLMLMGCGEVNRSRFDGCRKKVKQKNTEVFDTLYAKTWTT